MAPLMLRASAALLGEDGAVDRVSALRYQPPRFLKTETAMKVGRGVAARGVWGGCAGFKGGYVRCLAVLREGVGFGLGMGDGIPHGSLTTPTIPAWQCAS